LLSTADFLPPRPPTSGGANLPGASAPEGMPGTGAPPAPLVTSSSLLAPGPPGARPGSSARLLPGTLPSVGREREERLAKLLAASAKQAPGDPAYLASAARTVAAGGQSVREPTLKVGVSAAPGATYALPANTATRLTGGRPSQRSGAASRPVGPTVGTVSAPWDIGGGGGVREGGVGGVGRDADRKGIRTGGRAGEGAGAAEALGSGARATAKAEPAEPSSVAAPADPAAMPRHGRGVAVGGRLPWSSVTLPTSAMNVAPHRTLAAFEVTVDALAGSRLHYAGGEGTTDVDRDEALRVAARSRREPAPWEADDGGDVALPGDSAFPVAEAALASKASLRRFARPGDGVASAAGDEVVRDCTSVSADAAAVIAAAQASGDANQARRAIQLEQSLRLLADEGVRDARAFARAPPLAQGGSRPGTTGAAPPSRDEWRPSSARPLDLKLGTAAAASSTSRPGTGLRVGTAAVGGERGPPPTADVEAPWARAFHPLDLHPPVTPWPLNPNGPRGRGGRPRTVHPTIMMTPATAGPFGEGGAKGQEGEECVDSEADVLVIDARAGGGGHGGVSNLPADAPPGAEGGPLALRRDVLSHSWRPTNKWLHPAYVNGFLGGALPAPGAPSGVDEALEDALRRGGGYARLALAGPHAPPKWAPPPTPPLPPPPGTAAVGSKAIADLPGTAPTDVGLTESGRATAEGEEDRGEVGPGAAPPLVPIDWQGPRRLAGVGCLADLACGVSADRGWGQLDATALETLLGPEGGRWTPGSREALWPRRGGPWAGPEGGATDPGAAAFAGLVDFLRHRVAQAGGGSRSLLRALTLHAGRKTAAEAALATLREEEEVTGVRPPTGCVSDVARHALDAESLAAALADMGLAPAETADPKRLGMTNGGARGPGAGGAPPVDAGVLRSLARSVARHQAGAGGGAGGDARSGAWIDARDLAAAAAGARGGVRPPSGWGSDAGLATTAALGGTSARAEAAALAAAAARAVGHRPGSGYPLGPPSGAADAPPWGTLDDAARSLVAAQEARARRARQLADAVGRAAAAAAEGASSSRPPSRMPQAAFARALATGVEEVGLGVPASEIRAVVAEAEGHGEVDVRRFLEGLRAEANAGAPPPAWAQPRTGRMSVEGSLVLKG